MLQTPPSNSGVINGTRNQQVPTNTMVPQRKNPTSAVLTYWDAECSSPPDCIRDRQRESAPATQRFVRDFQLSLYSMQFNH